MSKKYLEAYYNGDEAKSIISDAEEEIESLRNQLVAANAELVRKQARDSQYSNICCKLSAVENEVVQLRQQLAEKDAEIEHLKEESRLPVKYYQPDGKGPIYAVCGASSINFTEYLLNELAVFNSAVEHVTEEGKTKRSFSVSEGWAMVHKERLIDLECAEEQLSASQAREQSLKSALLIEALHWRTVMTKSEIKEEIDRLFPSDTTALSVMIAKAGEVMLERAAETVLEPRATDDTADMAVRKDCTLTIRALPDVTLEDLK